MKAPGASEGNESIRGVITEDERMRLEEVSKEVNKMRQRLKRDYFEQRLNEKIGDLRQTWVVIGEALNGGEIRIRELCVDILNGMELPSLMELRLLRASATSIVKLGQVWLRKFQKRHLELLKNTWERE